MSLTKDAELFLVCASEKRLIENEFKHWKKWGVKTFHGEQYLHNMEPVFVSDKDCHQNAECAGQNTGGVWGEDGHILFSIKWSSVLEKSLSI